MKVILLTLAILLFLVAVLLFCFNKIYESKYVYYINQGQLLGNQNGYVKGYEAGKDETRALLQNQSFKFCSNNFNNGGQ